MKKSNLKKLVMMTLAMGALYVPGLASAEEAAAPQEFALDEVVVTANRMENKLVDTPANVAVVTAEEIERRNYQDAIEAVKNVPGVNVVEGLNSEERNIFIGGDERVLILVDGRRVGHAQGSAFDQPKMDASLLPNPANIERIEIVKGGGATVYGSDAVGGVINIITKKANENFIKLDANTGSWGSQNYKGVISQKHGKTGVFISAAKEKQNYMKFKENDSRSNIKYPNSNYGKTSVNLKVEQEVGNNQLATLYFDHQNKKGGRPGGLPYGLVNLNKGHKIDNNIALRYDWGVNTDKSGYVQVYRNNSNNLWTGEMKTTEKKIGADVQQSFKTSENNMLVAGVSYYKAQVETDSTLNPYMSNKYDRSINNKAIFVQDSWDFADSWKLNAGLRFDNHSTAGSKTTGSLAINKKFDDASHAYISWSQIFNTPNLDNMYYSEWGYYGNPNLKPEKGDIWTIGYDTKVGRKANFNTSVFYSKLKDAFDWKEEAGNHYAVNVSEQKRRGFDIGYRYNFDDNWSAFANYSYIKVENTDKDVFVRDYTKVPNNYKLGVSYIGKKLSADLYARGGSGAEASQYVDSKYLTMDLSVNYKIKDNWKLYVKGYNLTNASYAERAGLYGKNYSYPAAGRRFLVGTQITF